MRERRISGGRRRLGHRAMAWVLSGLTALVVSAICLPSALASPAVNISGTWVITGSYAQSSTVTMNPRTGTFSGHGVANNGTGYTWPDSGTVKGRSVHWVFGPYDQLKTYTATCNGTVSANGKTINGTCSDTNGLTGSAWLMTRKSGGAPEKAKPKKKVKHKPKPKRKKKKHTKKKAKVKHKKPKKKPKPKKGKKH